MAFSKTWIEGAIFPTCCPMWHDFGAISLGWFDEIGIGLTMAQTPNLG